MIEILSIDFPEIKVQKEKRDKLTPIRGTLSTKKAKNLIDYNPKWSLENGYPKYIEWYKEVFNS